MEKYKFIFLCVVTLLFQNKKKLKDNVFEKWNQLIVKLEYDTNHNRFSS